MTGTEYANRRRAMGLKQTALAHILGVGRRTVQRIEKSAEVGRLDELALRGLFYAMENDIALFSALLENAAREAVE